MNTFGDLLRSFRQASNDPDRLKKRLSQERLGELIGQAMGDYGFSGAAVSDWERGESKINADDRNVLIALIQVLYQCGGLQTLEDADRLLEVGNYRVLDASEAQRVFGEPAGKPDEKPLSMLDELKVWITRAQAGPSPTWPRVLAALMRWGMDHISISVRTILWMWLWLGAWYLIGPSLHFPFSSKASAVSAMVMLVIGSLLVPVCIGLLVNPKADVYWQAQENVSPVWLWLYTYQGASIGFNVGYFLLLPIVFVRYYLQLKSVLWLEFLAALVGLILGDMAAHVVPHNLWRAYGRLAFKDGGIFFIIVFMGALWGVFFLEFYAVLITPFVGSMVFLLAMTILVVVNAWQKRRKVK